MGRSALLTLGAMYLAADRSVPLKMLPFDNKNELLLVLDTDEGTTLERTDAAVRAFEGYLEHVPEVTDFTSYVGVASPMDFNGLVRHYYLRQGPDVAEVRIDLVGKQNRHLQSHAIGLRMRDDLTEIARAQHVKLKLVEVPPGPPVLASVVAEVYGQPDNSYGDLLAAATTVQARLGAEPVTVDTDNSVEAAETKEVFVTDKEKAALHGISVQTDGGYGRDGAGGIPGRDGACRGRAEPAADRVASPPARALRRPAIWRRVRVEGIGRPTGVPGGAGAVGDLARRSDHLP